MATATVSKSKSAADAIKRVQTSAEKICRQDTQVFPEAATDGDTFRQGDIYVIFREKMPKGYSKTEIVNGQLAPGDTMGSRHILNSLENVEMFKKNDAGMFDGPVIKLKKSNTITHPEHGHLSCPAGIYEISYQRNLNAVEQEERVRD